MYLLALHPLRHRPYQAQCPTPPLWLAGQLPAAIVQVKVVQARSIAVDSSKRCRPHRYLHHPLQQPRADCFEPVCQMLCQV